MSAPPEFVAFHIGIVVHDLDAVVDRYRRMLGIDPFDQPDVEASKDKTRALTQQYEVTRALPSQEPAFRENGIALYADPRDTAELGRHNTLNGYLKSHFGRVHVGDYVAFLA